jgi:hypothetical protein
MENENITPALVDLIALVTDLADETAVLVEQSAAHYQKPYVAALREKAQSFRDRAKTLRVTLGKFQPKQGL